MDIKSPVAEARNQYLYSASGAKLRVTQRWNSNYSNTPIIGTAINEASLDMETVTDYVGNKIYENGQLKRILIDGGYIEDGKYYFYLTDHLGNNRVVVDEEGNIVQQNDYYPFGMAFADNENEEVQPYKYNGKELDRKHELNWYDYSARYKDDWRFTSVDPHAESFYSWSPYMYCYNNPIILIDENGMYPSLGDIGDKIKKGAQKISSFVEGAAVAVIDNAAGGNTSVREMGKYSDAKAYNLGQDVGDIASVVIGAKEIISGVGATTGGVVAAPETLGLSLTVSIEGIALIAHGAVNISAGIKNLSEGKGRVSEMGSNGGGKGERGRTAKPEGTDNPFKKMTPDPNDSKKVKYKDANGKTKTKPKPEGFDDYWNKKHPPKNDKNINDQQKNER
ncbi:RHS repeat-associated core domain-containing protein [Dysgonomonas sp. 511]|uniref:RHS repeat-associated core domain-containing protein n=1 Tax=Dysgonomonas sp. 511 TaxID=2302930 RepID=UPI0013D20DDA|nr:RHS repeat-associated core domain-containing protein [Dysgonomonas sp. 511]NDV79991.1 hypothetical protein [Dysgonomonas sp. 511]